VTVEEVPEGTRVRLGGRHVFIVTKLDIDAEAGETPTIMAQYTMKRLEQAIRERREQETPRYLATAAGFCALATLLYGLLLWLIRRVNRWLAGRLAASAAVHSQRMRISGVHLFDSARVLKLARQSIILILSAIAIALSVAWLTFLLVQFPYTRPWGEQLEGNLLGIVKDILLAIVAALPGLVFAALIFVVAHGIVGIATRFFRRVEEGRLDVGWIDADTARPTRKLVGIVIWIFALAMAYPYLPGAETDAFKGLSVLVGLMVSLGASSVVGQAFSGLILMYTRTYRRGDYVRIGDSEGTVVELGMFITRIRTGLGEEISLPNTTVMSNSTKNYSRAEPGTGCVVDTVVTIGYSTPWRQVHALLEEAARRTPDIAAAPAPYVRQTALSDFYVEYRLVAYTPVESPAQRAEVLGRLHANIQDLFNEHGVQIMSPHYMMDPKEPQVVPKEQWYMAPARPPEKP